MPTALFNLPSPGSDPVSPASSSPRRSQNSDLQNHPAFRRRSTQLRPLHLVPDQGIYHDDHQRDDFLDFDSALSRDEFVDMSTAERDYESVEEEQEDEDEDAAERTASTPPAVARKSAHMQSTTELSPTFDLHPPRRDRPMSDIELLAERLFSVDHLRVIVRDGPSLVRMLMFLDKYKPDLRPLFRRYVETSKAATAIRYANAVFDPKGASPCPAASIDERYEAQCTEMEEVLSVHALPTFITYSLVQTVTEILVKEITGQELPGMKRMVNGLAEVYCMTDPLQPDNPIIYASEEFFRCTQYGRDYSIGRNCRFLQGPYTSAISVQRLVEGLERKEETCEVILNYRRDGQPFFNLLLIAPLFDDHGEVCYFIGAQIDINGLLENGNGLSSFARLLDEDKVTDTLSPDAGPRHKTSDALLGEMTAMFGPDEVDIARRTGRERLASDVHSAVPAPRRYLGMDDPTDIELWPPLKLGKSGRLPGVFQNYLLVRPHPSLRITFTSPALRIPGLLHSHLLDRIGGAPHIRSGIASALAAGVGVTAKVTWLPGSSAPDSGLASPSDPLNHSSPPSSAGGTRASRPGTAHATDNGAGRTRWLHCTPLLGADGRVGVYMAVMVEAESITGALNAHDRAAAANAHAAAALRARFAGREPVQAEMPTRIRPSTNASREGVAVSRAGQAQASPGARGGPASSSSYTSRPQSPTPTGPLPSIPIPILAQHAANTANSKPLMNSTSTSIDTSPPAKQPKISSISTHANSAFAVPPTIPSSPTPTPSTSPPAASRGAGTASNHKTAAHQMVQQGKTGSTTKSRMRAFGLGIGVGSKSERERGAKGDSPSAPTAAGADEGDRKGNATGAGERQTVRDGAASRGR